MIIFPFKYTSPACGLCYDTETAANSISAINRFLERRSDVTHFSYRAPRGQWFDVERTPGGFSVTAAK